MAAAKVAAMAASRVVVERAAATWEEATMEVLKVMATPAAARAAHSTVRCRRTLQDTQR